FVRYLTHYGPVTGVAASKVIAVVMGGVCVWLDKPHLVRWINYWYAALVVWNICIILACLPQAVVGARSPVLNDHTGKIFGGSRVHQQEKDTDTRSGSGYVRYGSRGATPANIGTFGQALPVQRCRRERTLKAWNSVLA